MPTRTIETDQDLVMFNAWLLNMPMPFTASIKRGVDRSSNQNALAFKWYSEISMQMGDRDASDVRAHCKFYHGIKMLVTEDEAFREQWNKFFRERFTFEEKLALMVEPHDYPVTRLMKVSQMTRYLEAIIAEFTPMGVQLTMPEGKL